MFYKIKIESLKIQCKSSTMPIKSYIAYPNKDQKNKDVIIIISDTSTNKEDKQLLENLNALDSLQMLSMVAGFETDQL